ncbi:MAG TPA: Uma2 family endonuclease, partial [Armatimonadota bacterium]|nr:Uma2 family endonuclease [Armatimonadota bacterium]
MSVSTWTGTSARISDLTEDDLPCSDGEPMETQRHVLQMLLLVESLSLHWMDRQDFFVAGNMFVYYRKEGRTRHEALGPDVFVALDVPRRERKSWVVWQEGKGPDVVIELLSESTAARDRGAKMRIYRDVLRVAEYFWYDPFSDEWARFELRDGSYLPIQPDAAGRLPSRRLGLVLTREDGEYISVPARWLRWATPEGVVLTTAAEAAAQQQQRAEHEQQRAEHEQQRADQEQQRAERLAAKLRALGVDPDG